MPHFRKFGSCVDAVQRFYVICLSNGTQLHVEMCNGRTLTVMCTAYEARVISAGWVRLHMGWGLGEGFIMTSYFPNGTIDVNILARGP